MADWYTVGLDMADWYTAGLDMADWYTAGLDMADWYTAGLDTDNKPVKAQYTDNKSASRVIPEPFASLCIGLPQLCTCIQVVTKCRYLDAFCSC